MLKGIDHVVIAVRDLDEAVENYRSLGFTVVAGGRHPIGTHNALIGFADGAYLELIAFERSVPGHRWWQWLQQGGGLTDVCLRTDDLAADLATFRRAGVKMEDPSPLSRVRPDGYTLEWKLAFPEVNGTGVVPFLIEDKTPREERVPRETTHPNNVTGIYGLVIAVEQGNEIERSYANILDEPGQPTEIAGIAVSTADLGPAKGRRFMVGPHSFDIAPMTSDSSPPGRWVKKRGPSIYSLSLTSDGKARQWLNEDVAMGARIKIL